MREFHYGRFALRFASLGELMRGEKFHHHRDQRYRRCRRPLRDLALPLAEVYRRAVDQQRHHVPDRRREPRPWLQAGRRAPIVVKSLIRENQPSRRTPASRLSIALAGWAADGGRASFDPPLTHMSCRLCHRIVVRAAPLRGINDTYRSCFWRRALDSARAPPWPRTTASASIQVGKPWSRATPKGAKVAGAYMTITNKGTAPDRLVGGSTAAASALRGPQHGDGAGRRKDAAGGLAGSRSSPARPSSSSLDRFT